MSFNEPKRPLEQFSLKSLLHVQTSPLCEQTLLYSYFMTKQLR